TASPGFPMWYTMIASNLGVSDVLVTTNERRVARAFLVDPAFQIAHYPPGPAGLPYYQLDSPPGAETQDAFSNTLPPVSPRLMIVSSISKPVPFPSGVAASSGDYSFNNLWAMQDGTKPPGASWQSWQDGDLKVQRVNLSDLFVQIVLNSQITDP